MSDEKDQEQKEPNFPDAEPAGEEPVTFGPQPKDSDAASAEETEEPQAAPQAAPDGMPTYEELEAKAAELKDQLWRTRAEAENTRRRSDREKSDLGKYAITNFAREMVSVADNLRRALGSVEESQRSENEALDTFCVGIEMTEKELTNAFGQFGISPIQALDQLFDHNLHQAMLEMEDPSKPVGTVVQEIQMGYMIHDRLLRPAMVGVAKGGPKPEPVAEAEPEAESQPAEPSVSESSQAYEKRVAASEPDDENKSGSKIDTKL